MTIMTWPTALKARIWDPHPRNLAASGGRSPIGREQRVLSDAGFWQVRVSGIAVRDRAGVLAYRALITRLRMGEDILLPVRDLFPARGSGGVMAVSFAASADLRATTVSLTVSAGEIAEGIHLQIGDRLHLVTEILSAPGAPPFVNQLVTGAALDPSMPLVPETSASATYSVRIWPPLRFACPTGTTAGLRNLRLRCVVEELTAGDLDLDLGRLGRPDLTFIESI